MAVGAPHAFTALAVTDFGNIGLHPFADFIQMFWCSNSFIFFIGVGMHIATGKTAAFCVAVIRFGIKVFSIRCNRIAFHAAILSVGRMTTGTGPGTAFGIRHWTDSLMDPVQCFG